MSRPGTPSSTAPLSPLEQQLLRRKQENVQLATALRDALDSLAALSADKQALAAELGRVSASTATAAAAEQHLRHSGELESLRATVSRLQEEQERLVKERLLTQLPSEPSMDPAEYGRLSADLLDLRQRLNTSEREREKAQRAASAAENELQVLLLTRALEAERAAADREAAATSAASVCEERDAAIRALGASQRDADASVARAAAAESALEMSEARGAAVQREADGLRARLAQEVVGLRRQFSEHQAATLATLEARRADAERAGVKALQRIAAVRVLAVLAAADSRRQAHAFHAWRECAGDVDVACSGATTGPGSDLVSGGDAALLEGAPCSLPLRQFKPDGPPLTHQGAPAAPASASPADVGLSAAAASLLPAHKRAHHPGSNATESSRLREDSSTSDDPEALVAVPSPLAAAAAAAVAATAAAADASAIVVEGAGAAAPAPPEDAFFPSSSSSFTAHSTPHHQLGTRPALSIATSRRACLALAASLRRSQLDYRSALEAEAAQRTRAEALEAALLRTQSTPAGPLVAATELESRASALGAAAQSALTHFDAEGASGALAAALAAVLEAVEAVFRGGSAPGEEQGEAGYLSSAANPVTATSNAARGGHVGASPHGDSSKHAALLRRATAALPRVWTAAAVSAAPNPHLGSPLQSPTTSLLEENARLRATAAAYAQAADMASGTLGQEQARLDALLEVLRHLRLSHPAEVDAAVAFAEAEAAAAAETAVAATTEEAEGGGAAGTITFLQQHPLQRTAGNAGFPPLFDSSADSAADINAADDELGGSPRSMRRALTFSPSPTGSGSAQHGGSAGLLGHAALLPSVVSVEDVSHGEEEDPGDGAHAEAAAVAVTALSLHAERLRLLGELHLGGSPDAPSYQHPHGAVEAWGSIPILQRAVRVLQARLAAAEAAAAASAERGASLSQQLQAATQRCTDLEGACMQRAVGARVSAGRAAVDAALASSQSAHVFAVETSLRESLQACWDGAAALQNANEQWRAAEARAVSSAAEAQEQRGRADALALALEGSEAHRAAAEAAACDVHARELLVRAQLLQRLTLSHGPPPAVVGPDGEEEQRPGQAVGAPSPQLLLRGELASLRASLQSLLGQAATLTRERDTLHASLGRLRAEAARTTQQQEDALAAAQSASSDLRARLCAAEAAAVASETQVLGLREAAAQEEARHTAELASLSSSATEALRLERHASSAALQEVSAASDAAAVSAEAARTQEADALRATVASSLASVSSLRLALERTTAQLARSNSAAALTPATAPTALASAVVVAPPSSSGAPSAALSSPLFFSPPSPRQQELAPGEGAGMGMSLSPLRVALRRREDAIAALQAQLISATKRATAAEQLQGRWMSEVRSLKSEAVEHHRITAGLLERQREGTRDAEAVVSRAEVLRAGALGLERRLSRVARLLLPRVQGALLALRNLRQGEGEADAGAPLPVELTLSEAVEVALQLSQRLQQQHSARPQWTSGRLEEVLRDLLSPALDAHPSSSSSEGGSETSDAASAAIHAAQGVADPSQLGSGSSSDGGEGPPTLVQQLQSRLEDAQAAASATGERATRAAERADWLSGALQSCTQELIRAQGAEGRVKEGQGGLRAQPPSGGSDSTRAIVLVAAPHTSTATHSAAGTAADVAAAPSADTQVSSPLRPSSPAPAAPPAADANDAPRPRSPNLPQPQPVSAASVAAVLQRRRQRSWGKAAAGWLGSPPPAARRLMTQRAVGGPAHPQGTAPAPLPLTVAEGAQSAAAPAAAAAAMGGGADKSVPLLQQEAGGGGGGPFRTHGPFVQPQQQPQQQQGAGQRLRGTTELLEPPGEEARAQGAAHPHPRSLEEEEGDDGAGHVDAAAAAADADNALRRLREEGEDGRGHPNPHPPPSAPAPLHPRPSRHPTAPRDSLSPPPLHGTPLTPGSLSPFLSPGAASTASEGGRDRGTTRDPRLRISTSTPALEALSRLLLEPVSSLIEGGRGGGAVSSMGSGEEGQAVAYAAYPSAQSSVPRSGSPSSARMGGGGTGAAAGMISSRSSMGDLEGGAAPSPDQPQQQQQEEDRSHASTIGPSAAWRSAFDLAPLGWRGRRVGAQNAVSRAAPTATAAAATVGAAPSGVASSTVTAAEQPQQQRTQWGQPLQPTAPAGPHPPGPHRSHTHSKHSSLESLDVADLELISGRDSPPSAGNGETRDQRSGAWGHAPPPPGLQFPRGSSSSSGAAGSAAAVTVVAERELRPEPTAAPPPGQRSAAGVAPPPSSSSAAAGGVDRAVSRSLWAAVLTPSSSSGQQQQQQPPTSPRFQAPPAASSAPSSSSPRDGRGGSKAPAAPAFPFTSSAQRSGSGRSLLAPLHPDELAEQVLRTLVRSVSFVERPPHVMDTLEETRDHDDEVGAGGSDPNGALASSARSSMAGSPER